MQLAKVEMNILTYLEHGSPAAQVVKELRNFFGYEEEEIKAVLRRLWDANLVYHPKRPGDRKEDKSLILSFGFPDRFRQDDVVYLVENSSEFRSYVEYKEFLKQSLNQGMILYYAWIAYFRSLGSMK